MIKRAPQKAGKKLKANSGKRLREMGNAASAQIDQLNKRMTTFQHLVTTRLAEFANALTPGPKGEPESPAINKEDTD